MGIFDGVLICTDLDGTLANGKDINQEDIEAINYFMNNGGLFTLCTGRVIHYLSDIFELVKPNTYVISLNGSTISDLNGENVLQKSFLQSDYTSLFDTVIKYSDYINDFFVYYENCTESTKYSPKGYQKSNEKIDTDKRIHKIVFSFNNETVAEKAEKEANDLKSTATCCTRSWPTGVELLNSSSTKGAAVRILKQTLGARLLICAGDYENDISMLEEADIGYAVGNAHKKVKDAADKITVSQSECAIAHIIEDIELFLTNR